MISDSARRAVSVITADHRAQMMRFREQTGDLPEPGLDEAGSPYLVISVITKFSVQQGPNAICGVAFTSPLMVT